MRGDRPQRPNPLRNPFWRLLLGLAGLGVCYMLAVPPNGGVDEQDHLVRAAATVRGDLVGHGLTSPDDQVRVYDVPIEFKGPHNVCWSRDPTVDASCLDYDVDPNEQSFALNGYYPPTYFAIVGWPSLAFTGYSALRPIRLASLVVCVALMAFGLHLACRRFGNRGALLAATAITPTTFFLFGVVNPQAVEVAAAFVVWMALPAVLDRTIGRREMWGFLAAGALLVSVRPLGSPFWFVILVVSVVLHGTDWRGAVRSVLRHRSIVAISALALVVTAWSLIGGVGSLENEQYARSVSLTDTIGTSFVNQLTWFHDAVGRLGWLDITPPAVTQWVWSVLLAVALVVGLVAVPRIRLALVLLALGYWGLQIYTSYTQASSNGLNWQGRYGLALLIGLVMVVLAALGPRLATARWAPAIAPALAIGQFASFYLALRRWTVGSNGPIWFAFDANWSPPLPTAMVLLGAVVSVALVGSAAIGTEARA